MVSFKSLLFSAAFLSTLARATPMPAYEMLQDCKDCTTETGSGQSRIGLASVPPVVPAVPTGTSPALTSTAPANTASENTAGLSTSNIAGVYTPPVTGDNAGDALPTGVADHLGATSSAASSALTPTSSILPLGNPPASGNDEHAPCEEGQEAESLTSSGTATGTDLPQAPPTETLPAYTSTPPVDKSTPLPTESPAPTSTPPFTGSATSTSTTAPVAPPAETTPPVAPAEPVYVKGDVPLWDQRPTRSDMAPLLGKDASWKELAAVADAIINVSPGWIPSMVFQAPEEYYDGLILMAEAADQCKPSIRVEKDNATKAHVSLTLFPLEDPLALNVTFDVKKDASKVVWHQALQAAWAHEEVQARLQTINSNYTGPFVDNDPSGNKYKVMALLEMLTGSPAQIAEIYPNANSANGSVTIQSAYDLWGGWLNLTPVDSLSINPTIVFNEALKLQPITRKVGTDKEFILHNCKKAGAVYMGENYEDKDAVDMAFTLDRLYELFLWSVRLASPTVEGGSQTALLEIKKDRTVNTEYFESP